MSGIIASSASKPMTAGETAVDDVESGYVTGESIALSASPAGSVYSWGLAIPSASQSARSGLSSKTEATPTIIPDVEGTYVLTCDVDGTAYVLRIAVTATTSSSVVGSITFLPKTDASVPSPASGVSVYYSSDQDALCQKDSAGAVSTVGVTSI